jgi:thioredoxin-related protein
MMKSFRQIACYSLFLLGVLAWNVNAGDELWTTDYEQARKDAAQAGKSLLIDFSGSDWCGWCIRLDKEVFSHDVFKKTVTKDFIPVLLDYPRDKSKIPEDVQAQNERLKNKYAIQGYPTIILADAKGRPYAKTGYQAGGPETYLEHLAALRQTGTELAKNLKQATAPDLKPMDKVRLLDKAVDGMDMSLLVEFYGDVIDQIMALDKDNKAGIRKKYELRLRAAQAEKALASRDTEKAIELYEALIRDFQPTGEQAQALYFSLSEAYFGARQMDKAKAGLDKALLAAPESKTAARIKTIIKRYFSEPVKE